MSSGDCPNARDSLDKLDTTKPSVARIYDYTIGGKDNFEVDRVAVRDLLAGFPDIVGVARQNREFLGRAVRYLAEHSGIRQFIDNGCGLPTHRNVHQIAQETHADARVVYVDKDPVVHAYGQALLAGTGKIRMVQADLRRPEEILQHPYTREVIDFDEPVAVLCASVLHCLPDEAEPARAVRCFIGAVPRGSHLLVSHLTSRDAETGECMKQLVRTPQDWGRVRMEQEITGFFDGLEPVEPGLVNVRDWRPDPHVPTMLPESRADSGLPPPVGSIGRIWQFGGLARKP